MVDGFASTGASSPFSQEENDVFRLLENDRRRLALHYLLEHSFDESHSIGEVAEQIAAWENHLAVDEISAKDRKLVYNSLQQSHFPELEDHEIIRYNEAKGTVTLTRQGRAIEKYLYPTETDDRPWWTAILIVAILGIVVALLYPFEIPLVSALSPTIWLAVISFTIGLLTIGNFTREPRLPRFLR